MRIRDVLMVVIALGGLIFGWLQEGSLHLQRSFVVTLTDTDILIHNYAKPVVADLHGDGKPVLIACPRNDMIAIYPTYLARRNFEDVFVHLAVSKKVQIYSSIVGMGVGKIDLYGFNANGGSNPTSPSSTSTAAAKGRMIIVVVTDDYRIEAFDADLMTLWSASVVPPGEAGIILHHASVRILPERIYEQDHGTVVVSVNIAGANGTEHLLAAAFAADNGELRWRHVADEYKPLTIGYEMQPPDDLPLLDDSVVKSDPPAVDDADDAKGDSTEKKNKNKNKKESAVVPSTPAGFGALRMTTDALAEHSNALHWTHFREAVVGAMPHTYRHAWDDTIDAHVFFHAKNRKKTKGKGELHNSGSGGANKYKDRRIQLDTTDVGELGETAGVGNNHRPHRQIVNTTSKLHHPNVLVLHRKNAVEVLHLYTGKRVTRVYPLHKDTVYHDMDDDFHLDAVSTRFGSHSSAHHRHGMDQIVDCLGVVTSNVPQGQDAMYNATICDSEGLLSGLKFVSSFLHGDQPSEHPQLDPLSLIGSHNVVSSTTHGVTPVVVQHLLRRGRDLFKVQRHAVFMIDTGLVTCIDPVTKRVVWRVQTEATFPDLRQAQEEEVSFGLHSEEEKETRLRKFPHLVKYSLHQSSDVEVHSAKQRYRETDPFVLAVGEKHLAAINARSGDIEEMIDLEQTPVAPSMVVDVNGDGVNDVLIFSANSIYGYIAQPRGSTSTIAMLMILMVGVLATLVIARELRQHDDAAGNNGEILPGASGGGHAGVHQLKRVKRSTD